MAASSAWLTTRWAIQQLEAERDDILAWREEDIADGHPELAPIADEFISRLQARIDALAEREYDQRIGRCDGR